ncbi:MAG: ferritin-like domain-containing protein [Proteobacteria bacterium]|nr:ferritin-like domain-containing protein [Pseudomonadota bacterium]
MELRELARRVLYSTCLEDKLAVVETWSDDAPGAPESVPDWPARPDQLRLDAPKQRSAFPSLAQLEDDTNRGRVLHFFANHELLAMELMALVLLRFPGAPPSFRRGVAGMLADEQRHMRLYLDRMAELGVGFGDVRPNAFFWNSLKDMHDPMEFAVGMALTFEQANLDYCLHYGGAFRKLGDTVTEDVLEQVYVDEVRHVAHGLKWFRRWKDPDESDWEAFVARQKGHMTPARARGLGFSVAAREEAGLDTDFIRNLSVFRASKGRRPTVHWFNAGTEPSLADPAWAPDNVTQTLRSDLALLPMLLASEDDVVLVPELPSTAFREHLVGLGIPLPGFVTSVPDNPGGFAPFGHSPESRRVLGGGLDRDASWPRSAWNDRTGARAIRSLDDLPAGDWLLKTELSSSGRGLRRATDDPSTRGWLANQGHVLAERRLDRVVDLSAVYRGSKLLGLTRPLSSPQGRYVGHVVGHAFDGLAPEVHRFIAERDLRNHYHQLGRELALEDRWGIDFLLHRVDGQLALREVVEVNPRMTMGHFALALRRAFPRGGRFSIVSPCEVGDAIPLTDPLRARRFVAILEPR